MMQINLLPDVKIEFIKAERLKRLVIMTSTVVAAISLLIFLILLGVVDGVQKHQLNSLTNQVETDSAQLKNTPDISKILTVQNQLESLPQLNNQKAVASRLFGYITEVTPTNITISNLTVDFTQDTMNITGDAPSLDNINTYVDTLKFTTFTEKGQTNNSPAFTNVVLSSFGRSSQGATYTIDLDFNKAIFSEANTVTLTVPNTITTRSEIDQPSDLFKQDSGSITH